MRTYNPILTFSRLLRLVLLATFSVSLLTLDVHNAVYASTLDNLEQAELSTNFEKHERTTKLINYLIDKSHYKKVSLDDNFSEKVLARFIEQLDPAKSFFIKEDIEQFDLLKHEFDDFIKQGNLEPAYTIFKIYRTRVHDRIEFALGRLDDPFDFTIDELFVLDRDESDWAQNTEVLNDYWRKRIKNDIINLKLASKSEKNIFDTLKRRYTHIARRTGQFKSEDVFQNFINAYVSTIEPHTSYYSPRGAENFKIHMRLSLEGIGAILQSDNEYTLVRRVIPGGPADLSGVLKSNDRIIGVGQENGEMVDVVGWRLDDVVDLIRGPKGSIVNLEFLPGTDGLDGEPKRVPIARDEIKLEEQAAKKQLIEVETSQTTSRLGVIQLPSFYTDFDGRNVNNPNYRSTTRDVRQLIDELKKDDINGLVIDLRGNGGGALSEAISLTGLFIKKGPVVQVQNSNGRTQIDRDSDPEIAYSGPLVVLVDRNSASASEIFAGAIQDYNRGLIVGEPTFGKGTVQNLVSLNRFVQSKDDLGQLKVTIAQFFRINGDSTQHRGVIPDITWSTSIIEDQAGERSYENAIPWRHIDEVAYVPFDQSTNSEALNKAIMSHLARIKTHPEFEFARDINALNQLNLNQKSITLTEDKRRDNRRRRDLERLVLENKRRKALGKPEVASISFLEAVQNDAASDDNTVTSEADAFLVESGKILMDFVHYQNDKNPLASTTLVNQQSQKSHELLNN